MSSGLIGSLGATGRARSARLGLSQVELLACLLAVAAGLWAGTAYLGIDLQAALRLGMVKAGIAAPALEPSGEVQAETPADPAGEAAHPESATTPADQDEPPEQKAQAASSPAPQSAAEATLAYFKRLREIIREEEQMRYKRRAQGVRDPRAVLQSDSRAYALAAESIRQVPTRSVDPLAVQLGRDLAAWYARGAEVAGKGASLLDEGDLTEIQGPLGRRWHASQKQHAQELDLLADKCGSVCRELTSRYRLRFPDLL